MTMEFEFALDLPPKSSRRVLQGLHKQLRGAILDGRLASGLQLPSSRALSHRLGLSRNTVVAVYDRLLSEGYIVARPGAGTFVAAVRRAVKSDAEARPPDARINVRWRTAQPLFPPPRRQQVLYDFRLGAPDIAQFPFPVWRKLLNRSLREVARTYPTYRDPAGEPELREAIAKHVSFTRAVACDPENIVVTAGAQQAFDLLARVLVTPGKTVVAVENPGYPPTRVAFAKAGAIIEPISVDTEGIRVAELPAAVNIVCVTPSHQFPLGVPLSPARRAALLKFAAERDAVIIEDDYDGEFRFEGRPLDALQTLDSRDAVFHVGTFSKSLFPMLRQGFLVSPRWALPSLCAARQLIDWHGAWLDQPTLAEFIREGHLARHVRRMRKIYEVRRRVLSAALHRHCRGRPSPLPSYAGLHLSALIEDGDPGAVVKRAAASGMVLESFGRFASAPTSQQGLTFGYGLIRHELIDEGIARVAQALDALSASVP
jgi:GntR family transcriptional regulator/MocR family aminotransferase